VALTAVRAAPGLLGAHGPRRYFLAFTTPSEARGLGGFMGNFAVLTADDGRITLTRSDRTSVIETRPGEPSRPLDAPPDYVARYGSHRPQDVLRDVTLSPDFPSVAQVIRGAYPAGDGAPLDGVLAVDPYTIAAVLAVTGPVHVEGLDEPLTHANAADVLLRRQYEAFEEDNAERIDVLDQASRAAFEALLRLDAVEPARWATALGPMVTQGRLLAWSPHGDAQRLFAVLGMDGAFPPPADGDFVAVTTQNSGNNKIDVFLHRSLAYRARWDPATGALSTRATITLRNDAPASGPPYLIRNRPSARQPDGTNWLTLELYSPHSLAAATVDGRPLPMAAQREFDRNVYRAYVAVPSGATAKVDVDLTGWVPPGERYTLGWYRQPGVHPGTATVELEPVGREVGTGGPTRTLPLERDGAVSFDLRPR
jgi:hypothetical protein